MTMKTSAPGGSVSSNHSTTVAAIANGIAKHGLAFAHWAALLGTEDADKLAGFDDAYLGHFGSLTEYGEDFLESVGLRQELDEAIPELLAAYVDIDVGPLPATWCCPATS